MRLYKSVAVAILASAVTVNCGKDSPTGAKHVGPPAGLTIVSGDQQQGVVGTELANAIVVKVVDDAGNPIQGQVINFRVTAGGGSVFAGSSSTNADGIAQERWTLGTVADADQSLEARAVDNATGAALVFATFHATAVAGPAAKLALMTQPSAAAHSGRTLDTVPVVRLADKYGNLVHQSGVTVTASLPNDNSGRILTAGGTTNTDASGVATFSGLTITGAAGALTLTFTAGNLTSVASTPITLGAGTPTQLKAVGPTTFIGTVGSPLSATPKVIAEDAVGNPVQGVSVQFAVSDGGGTISPTSVATDVNGVAGLASWTLGNSAGTYMVTASASAIAGSTVTFTATVQPGAATQLTIVSGDHSSAAVGSAAPALVVKVTDAQGNPVTGAVVSWAIASGGGTLSAPTSTTNNSGQATAMVTLPNAAGTVHVTASIGSTATVMFTITAVAGQVASLTTVAGDGQSAVVGTPVAMAPAVQVKDANGNPVVGVTVTFAIASGGGSLTNSLATSNASGVATVGSWTLGTAAGPNSVTASLGGNVVTFTATATAGLPTALAVVQNPASSATSGVALTVQPKVGLRDQYGNAVAKSGVTVTATTTTAGVTFTGQTTTTDGTGVATFTALTASGPSTTFAITFTAAGLTSATSNSIALAGVTSYTWVGGDPAGARDWFNPRNWSPAAVPGAGDDARIPFVSSSSQPQLTRDAAIRDISIEVGSTLDVQSYTLAPRSVSALGPIIGSGTVTMAIDSSRLVGQVPNLSVTGAVRMTGATIVTGNANITGRLNYLQTPTVYGLTVNGDVTVVGAGAHLSTYNNLSVGGTLTLDGGDFRETGDAKVPWDLLGEVDLKGDLVLGSTYSPRVLPPQTLLYLVGSGLQRVRGSAKFAKEVINIVVDGNAFAHVAINKSGGSVSFEIPITDQGNFVVSSATKVDYPPNETLAIFGEISANVNSDLSGISTLELFGGHDTGGTLQPADTHLPDNSHFPTAATRQPSRVLVSGHYGIAYGNTHLGVPLIITGSVQGLSGESLTLDSTLTISGPSAHLLATGGGTPNLHVGGTALFDGSSDTKFATGSSLEFGGNVVVGSTYSSRPIYVATGVVTRFVGATDQSVSGTAVFNAQDTANFSSFSNVTVAKSGGTIDVTRLSNGIRDNLNVESPTRIIVPTGSRVRIGGGANTATGSDLSAIGTLESYGKAGFGQINGTPPQAVEISGQVVQAGTNSLNAPVLVSGTLSVKGNLTLASSFTVQGPNAHVLMAVGGISPVLTVVGAATFDGGNADVDLQIGTLNLRGNLTVGSTYTPKAFSPINAFIVQFSGTSAQPQSVSGATLFTNSGNDSNLNYVKILAGADIAISDAYLRRGLDQQGTLTVPSGKRLVIGNQPGSGAFLHLFSGSVTTVQGALINNGTCTADAGATYSGFTCP